MEQRSQEANRVASLVIALLLASPVWAAELRYEVRHERMVRDHYGILTIDEKGVSYQETHAKKKSEKLERARWDYQDIQELKVSPERLVVVTYTDRNWLLGIDKEFEFYAPEGKSFEEAYSVLKDKLDQRFVAALADSQAQKLWELPVKLLGTLRGSEGVLDVGPDRVVYKTDRKGQSRTWRYQDIENVSTSGPFQLTLTTYERAKTHYGSLKGFNFQLKQRLDEKRYDLLWKRLGEGKGLRFLTSVQERNQLQ